MLSSELEELKSKLAPIYNSVRRWSYEEECLLLLLIRVPNYLSEVHQVIEFWNALPAHGKNFFPHTMTRLLTDWTGVLDKAAVARRKADGPIEVTASQKILWQTELKRIEKRLKDLRTILDGDGLETPTKEHREEVVKLRARRKELIHLLGFTV